MPERADGYDNGRDTDGEGSGADDSASINLSLMPHPAIAPGHILMICSVSTIPKVLVIMERMMQANEEDTVEEVDSEIDELPTVIDTED